MTDCHYLSQSVGRRQIVIVQTIVLSSHGSHRVRLQPARTAGAVRVQLYSIKAEVIALIALNAQYLYLFQP
jgi:hypothetical protein